MIGIKAISTHIGTDKLDNYLQAKDFGANDAFIKNKVGFEYLAQKSSELETSDLCVLALEKLLNSTQINKSDIGCLVVVTQNPDEFGLPHVSAIVHGKMGFPTTCAAFDLSLGCSGYVYALSVVSSFMQANSFDYGVIVTADPYSKIINPDDKNTRLLFGDGATTTLLGKDPIWDIGKFDFGTAGEFHNILKVDEKRQLKMNGRGVFNCSIKEVPKSIANVLLKNGMTINQIDKFLVHQGSRYIVDTLLEKLGVDQNGFFATDYGNTVSSSIPIMLQQNVSETDSSLLLAGFGVGFSWGTTILTRRK